MAAYQKTSCMVNLYDEREAKEELEDGDDDDMAYRHLSDPKLQAPPQKKSKQVTETNKRPR